ncbi:AIPR family protein [Methylobacterium sp. D53M]|jgi:hypothetical protein
MALDPVTASLLKEFSIAQNLENQTDEEKFEHFVNNLAVSDVFPGEFTVSDLATGQTEFGIDGIAIIVNDTMIEEDDQFDDIVQATKTLECDFVFIQSKTSNHFDSGEMLKTLSAIIDFFSKDIKFVQGIEVKSKFDIKNKIYDQAHLFTRRLPQLTIFFASLGKWSNDTNLNALIEQKIEQLKNLNIFSKVSFRSLDTKSIQDLYFKSKNSVSATIEFPASVALPNIPNVKEAYIGVIGSNEFMKLILDENENIRKFIFSDNVRDVLADSDVNKKIGETLVSDTKSEFPLRNNGITIVARSLTRAGNKFVLQDYQIVNGCQTSHVIFDKRSSMDASIVVPIKIISTENEDVTSEIIKGSNRQNEVAKTQFWALEPYQKQIELFFDKNFVGELQLLYERRRGQYVGIPGVEKVRITTPEGLLKAFSAMMLDEPHQVTKYYSGLLPFVGNRIFNNSHNLFPYHAAAYAIFKLEQLFRNRNLDSRYQRFRVYRYQTIMGFKYLVNKAENLDLNKKSAEKYSKKLTDVLSDQAKIANHFDKIMGEIEKIEKMEGINELNRRIFAKSAVLRNKLRERILAAA